MIAILLQEVAQARDGPLLFRGKLIAPSREVIEDSDILPGDQQAGEALLSLRGGIVREAAC